MRVLLIERGSRKNLTQNAAQLVASSNWRVKIKIPDMVEKILLNSKYCGKLVIDGWTTCGIRGDNFLAETSRAARGG
jgi:hypothetical protein